MSWSSSGRAGSRPGSACRATTARAAGPSWSKRRSRRRRRDAADRALPERRARPVFARRRPGGPARWRARFFLNVMAWRSRNRQTTLCANRSPCRRSRWLAISASVMSRVAATSPRISSAWASIRSERLSPPCGRGALLPVSRHRRTHFTAVDAATPNRSAAARRLIPAATASISRSRRSLDRGFVMQAGLLCQPTA